MTNNIRSLFEFRKTDRHWHVPVIAALGVGLPLLAGLLLGKPELGALASMGGLVTLYLPMRTVPENIITVLCCSFGFISCFAVGLFFSFHFLASCIAIGVLAAIIHWTKNYFSLKAPGNFFFIMLLSLASCMPFDLAALPAKVGLVAIGTMAACFIAITYTVLFSRKHNHKRNEVWVVRKRGYTNTIESLIIGLFAFLSLFIGRVLNLDFPYWIPISCLAVMQGVDTKHVFQRSLHRIVGTFIGLILAWVLLSLKLPIAGICVSIIILQYIIEVLVVRNYAFAVIFITPMTLFLAEMGNIGSRSASALIMPRVLDIVLGSLLGAIGGWLLYHRRLHLKALRTIKSRLQT